MPIRVRIEFEGIDTVIGNLEAYGEELPVRIEEVMAKLADETQEAWQEATPVRTGHLRQWDVTHPGGMTFTLENPVYYYPFVDAGHAVRSGWRVKGPVVGHVAARNMTQHAVQFVEGNLLDRLGSAISGE